MSGEVGRNDRRMLMAESTQQDSEQHNYDFDLSSSRLDETDQHSRSRSEVVARLDAYRILPPSHTRLTERTLEQIEQLYVTWFELADDGSRRAAVSYLFATDSEVRAALLAIVPLYYDSLFFDERTPTKDLIEITLVAHSKWRRWLAA
jgi:hypothetical protein